VEGRVWRWLSDTGHRRGALPSHRIGLAQESPRRRLLVASPTTAFEFIFKARPANSTFSTWPSPDCPWFLEHRKNAERPGCSYSPGAPAPRTPILKTNNGGGPASVVSCRYCTITFAKGGPLRLSYSQPGSAAAAETFLISRPR